MRLRIVPKSIGCLITTNTHQYQNQHTHTLSISLVSLTVVIISQPKANHVNRLSEQKGKLVRATVVQNVLAQLQLRRHGRRHVRHALRRQRAAAGGCRRCGCHGNLRFVRCADFARFTLHACNAHRFSFFVATMSATQRLTAAPRPTSSNASIAKKPSNTSATSSSSSSAAAKADGLKKPLPKLTPQEAAPYFQQMAKTRGNDVSWPRVICQLGLLFFLLTFLYRNVSSVASRIRNGRQVCAHEFSDLI
jgi:hypothetical protein